MRAFSFFMSIYFFMATNLAAQIPPSLGPPLAGVADIPLQKIKFSNITQLIEEGLSIAINNTNHQIEKAIASSGLKAKLSGQMMAVMPSYGQTKFTTKQNERVVRLQIKLCYTLSDINYHNSLYPSRKLIQQMLVTISCDKWNTDIGKSKTSYTAEMPQSNEATLGATGLDSYINDTLALSIYNNLLTALSKDANPGELYLPTHSCNCMSFKMGTGPVFADGYAGFYYLPIRKIGVESLYSNPTIRLLSVEQLPADGEGLLMPGNNIEVQYMANYNTSIVKLRGFKENEKVLHRKMYDPMEFEHPNKYNQLIVIANLTLMDDTQQTFSGFVQFDKSQKYGEGLQKLTVMKKELIPKVVSPDDPPITPEYEWVPAFELVFQIDYQKK